MEELAEVSVHHPLEEGRCIHQAKIHDLRDESLILCFKCCLVLVFLCDLDVVVSPSYVEFREEGLIPQVFKRFSNIREWVVVLDCPLVDFSIVHNDALFLRVLLVNEVDRQRVRGWSFLDSSELKFLGQEFVTRGLHVSL